MRTMTEAQKAKVQKAYELFHEASDKHTGTEADSVIYKPFCDLVRTLNKVQLVHLILMSHEYYLAHYEELLWAKDYITFSDRLDKYVTYAVEHYI